MTIKFCGQFLTAFGYTLYNIYQRGKADSAHNATCADFLESCCYVCEDRVVGSLNTKKKFC